MIDAIRNRIFENTKDRAFFGWLMVAAAGWGMFTSGAGQSHTFAVFLKPIGESLDVSKSMIAIAYGVATFLAAWALPYVGTLYDRHGQRKMLLWIVSVLGFCCLFFGAAANLLWLIVAFGLLRFVGQGSVMMGSTTLVSNWFNKRRGIAMSLAMLGFGLSMAIHPPLGHFLIEAVGWRWAWMIMGLLTWIQMLPVIIFVIVNKPEDKALLPDGVQSQGADDIDGAANGLNQREALRHSSLHIIAFGWISVSMLMTTLNLYQIDILEDLGLSRGTGASIYPFTAVTFAICLPFVGWLLDRFKTRYIFALALLVQAASLIAITFATTVSAAIVYALIFGLNNAFGMTMYGYLWPRFFGRKHLGSLQGLGMAIAIIGASLGPLPIGFAFDMFESPVWTLRVLAIYPIIAAIIAATLLRTHPDVKGSEHLE